MLNNLVVKCVCSLTHNKSYRKRYSCVKISVTEGGKGDTPACRNALRRAGTTQHRRIRPCGSGAVFPGPKKKKTEILDEFVANTGLHRKVVIIRLLDKTSGVIPYRL